MAKVQPHLQSSYAAEVCGGLGVLTSIKQIMTDSNPLRKVDLVLRHRVISFGSKLSCTVHKLINIKSTHVRNLSTIKIAVHQDDAKKSYEMSFLEHLNV